MDTLNPIKLLTLIAMGAILSACGREAPVAPEQDEAAAPETPEVEPLAEGEEGFSIEIGGDDNMRFDVTEFTVEPGQHVTITFNNVGTMPKASMGHNLVVLRMGVDKLEFARDAQRHIRNEYVAPEREGDVIASTRVLGPGESATLVFRAPEEPGDYDYVCSFPGHTEAGMVGIMTVE